MIWILLLFSLLMGLLIYFWIRERRYLKKKTSEVMSRRVWKEIVEERETTLQKRRTFRDAFERAKQKQ